MTCLKPFCLLSELIIIVMEIMVFLLHDFWSSMLPYTYVMAFVHIYSVYLLGDEWFHTTWVRNNFQRAFCHWRPLSITAIYIQYFISILDTRILTGPYYMWKIELLYIWISIIHMILQSFGSELM